MSSHLPRIDMAPFRLSGVVVGALLNDPALIAALGDSANQPPYKAPPRAPVLEVKPPHTFAGDGDALAVPHGTPVLEIGASLGIVIGRTACRVARSDAMQFVAGYLLVGDVSLPVTSHYRPSVRLKARDGFCLLGSVVVPADDVPDPDALEFEVRVDGLVVQRGSTAGRVRGVADLIADVTDFMTLRPGDLLLLGRAHGAAQARAGQAVTISMPPLGHLKTTLQAEAAATGGAA